MLYLLQLKDINNSFTHNHKLSADARRKPKEGAQIYSLEFNYKRCVFTSPQPGF